MTLLMDIIGGMFISIVNVIPDVNDGTMVVSLGIYDELISSISSLLKDWRKNLATLLPIILGCGIGIVGFSYAIELLLNKCTFVIYTTFMGLTLGGVPVFVRALKKDLHKKNSPIGVSGIITFLALFAVAASLSMLNEDTEVLETFAPTAGAMISLFLVGIIASATMAALGVNDSLVMTVLGYYYGILEAIRSFIEALKDLDTAGPLDGFLLLSPLGIGVLFGISLIAKLITFLFERYGVQAYYAIFGPIVASPSAIFYNTRLFEQLSLLKAGSVSVGIMLAIVGAVMTRYLGEQSE